MLETQLQLGQCSAAHPVRTVLLSTCVTLVCLQEDRIHILNSIAGQPDLDAEPLEQHPSYNAINVALRWRVGIACYETADEPTRCALQGQRH